MSDSVHFNGLNHSYFRYKTLVTGIDTIYSQDFSYTNVNGIYYRLLWERSYKKFMYRIFLWNQYYTNLHSKA